MKRFLSTVRRGRTFWGSSASASEPGQFGLQGLHSARDWEGIATRCVERCEKLVEAIRATTDKPTVKVLDLFDNLSNDICIVLDTYVVDVAEEDIVSYCPWSNKLAYTKFFLRLDSY